ncbi:MAG: FtsK/SpoIIIE domain-containing protein, partial [Oscillospiraceae bacterium]
LVAGTTGSGKSELLQSYILAMSICYPPHEVAFLIIDFKGGGLANQLRELPHLAGTITNIDGREISRSLKSIKAELKKRQYLFAKSDVNKIDDYIMLYNSGAVSVPLPHLIIVVDEFAELKADQPEFMKELISAARIGRSLGIHLILATQKPAGQVNDQIWSNTRFRLCLKVQSSEDSNEMLKSPLAAEIREAGRAYLQVGNDEIFELFQSAYSGGAAAYEEASVQDDFRLAEVSLWGKRKVVFEQKFNSQNRNGKTQLEAVIDVINSYCVGHRIKKLPGICLPPLPEKICLPAAEKCGVSKGAVVNLGIYDDPDNQIQEDVSINISAGNLIIVGSSQSGKTNALQAIIRNLADRYTSDQINLYILDFGSMILKNFDKMVHVGGVAVSSEEEKIKNLFKMILSEMAVRKERLAASGVSSFMAYLEAGGTDLPQIVLMIDNFTAFRELYANESESLLTICRDGVTAGISVVLANSQTSGLGYKYMANFSNRIAFFCNDTGEYSTLFDRCRMTPENIPGRGLLELNHSIMEFQSYLCFEGEREIDRVNAMRRYVESVNQDNRGEPARRIPVVPELVTRSGIKAEQPGLFRTAYRIPFGMNYATMNIECLNLLQLGALGICGREGTG